MLGADCVNMHHVHVQKSQKMSMKIGGDVIGRLMIRHSELGYHG
jgi:hypothetical protein